MFRLAVLALATVLLLVFFLAPVFLLAPGYDYASFEAPPPVPCPQPQPHTPPLQTPKEFTPFRFFMLPKFGAPIPPWSPTGQFPATEALSPHLAALCTMDSCFDFIKCSKSVDGVPLVYVYNTTVQRSWLAEEMLTWIRSTPYSTSNPDEACVFIPDTELHCHGNSCAEAVDPGIADMALRSLPYWNGGRNHLLIAESDFPVGQWKSLVRLITLDRAILVYTNFAPGEIRPFFDISIPLESRSLDVDWTVVPKPAAERKYLLTFRGSRYNGCGEPIRSAVRWLGNEDDVVIRLRCQGISDLLCPKDEVEYKKGPNYKEMVTETKFGLVVRGCGTHSYRLTELVRARTVPVILADGFVPPLFELSGSLWHRCVLQFPESYLPYVVHRLRNISSEETEARMDACEKLYKIWTGRRGFSSNLRSERLEATLRTIGMRIGFL